MYRYENIRGIVLWVSINLLTKFANLIGKVKYFSVFIHISSLHYNYMVCWLSDHFTFFSSLKGTMHDIHFFQLSNILLNFTTRIYREWDLTSEQLGDFKCNFVVATALQILPWCSSCPDEVTPYKIQYYLLYVSWYYCIRDKMSIRERVEVQFQQQSCT